MLHFVLQKKGRIKTFIRDAAKGFNIMWQSSHRLTILNVILYILQAVLPLLSLIVLKLFIDNLVQNSMFSWKQTGWLVVTFFFIQAANIIVTELAVYFLELHQEIISNEMVGKVLQKSVALELAYFEDPHFYDELYMAQQQSLYRPAELIGSVQALIQNAITILLFSGFLFTVHWIIPCLLVLLSVPLALSKLVQGYQRYLLDRKNTSLQRRAYDLFDYLTSNDYAKEVRLFNFGDSFIRNFQSIKKAIYKKSKSLNFRFLKYNISIQLFEVLIIIIVYGIIIQQTILTTVSIGGLVVYFTSFQRLQAAISSFYNSCIQLFQQQLYLNQLFAFLSIPDDSREKKFSHVPSFKEGIRIKGLSFSYPNTDNKVLQNIHMHFPPGKVVAIVGENGSGKSTLVKLLSGLYQVKQGTLFLGDTDINKLHNDTVRKCITALFQDFGKYYLTVKDNITLGEAANESNLQTSVNRSGFYKYLSSFKAGYGTHLGRAYRDGIQLSGGQWQKLALARVFFRKSLVLILDEPTSALDPTSEYEVLQSLKDELTPERVIILISHRLYNLKVADYIYVLNNGSIVEEGIFEELLQSKGLFYETYKTQMV